MRENSPQESAPRIKPVLLGLLDWLKTDVSQGQKAKTPAATGKKEARPNRHRSVTIVHARNSCPAVKALAEHRFLTRDAPQLPLPNCTLSKQCHCSFRKHDDRRDFDDRRLAGERGKWYGGAENRKSRGRRSSSD
jgi:hypothetical protein